MEPRKIKQISDRLYPQLLNPLSKEFSLLCKIKKQIQETATLEFSEGDKISISSAQISDPVFYKLSNAGRDYYEESPNEDVLFFVSYSIATIMKEYQWDFGSDLNQLLSYISKRVESSDFNRKVLLRSLLDDVDAYCKSSWNWVSRNLPLGPNFHNDVENWQNSYRSLSEEDIYKKIETATRNVVVEHYHWDEFDVDGFSWAIGSFAFICLSAGLISSFNKAFKIVYNTYVVKGLRSINKVDINMKDPKLNEYEFVDLGLPSGNLWATCNIGADSPESVGDYYSWGEISPKNNYSHDTYKFRTDKYGIYSKYRVDSVDRRCVDKLELSVEDDIAALSWGGKWQIPSTEDFKELIEFCEIKPIDDGYNTRGINIIGLNGKSIYLPTCDIYHNSAPGLLATGAYWTKNYWLLGYAPEYVKYDPYISFLSFSNGNCEICGKDRYCGMNIRPVWK